MLLFRVSLCWFRVTAPCREPQVEMTRRITAKVVRIDWPIGDRLNGQCDLQAGETARHFSRAMRLGKATGFGVPREAQADVATKAVCQPSVFPIPRLYI